MQRPRLPRVIYARNWCRGHYGQFFLNPRAKAAYKARK
jgi:hypothetical protein